MASPPMSRTPSLSDTLGQIQKVYSEWCIKAGAVILGSRFPHEQHAGSCSSSGSGAPMS
eukprot:CAMPEP_0178394300 /NCGR_PEP_ID=MMETSP0689_2-20121128/12635_1 /TAXON_ID=160604 /ORGANISM="Amphidinium massartii, Strain CS-259" /LENGTH=58 /DNA_ID=CAMNT_0020014925 /DNA_START=75 /DNA_END=247 /DNA_ORIENTATION=+